MSYTDLSKCIVDWLLKIDQWHRAVSIDVEADLATLEDPEKIILSLSVARRIDNQIDIKKFVLNEETATDEVRIFGELGTEFQQIRPLILIGFGNGWFDQPILALKLRQLDDLFKQDGKYQPGYWALKDTITRSYVLDMMDPVKFEIAKYDNAPWKRHNLEKAIAHPRFKHLTFRNTKNIVSSRLTANPLLTKWEVIHDLWKNDRKSFEQYIEGDVHDTLLLSEEVFCRKNVT